MFRIGVSGHRQLANIKDLSNAVDKVLETIIAEIKPDQVSILSSLAEGADRLVAQKVIDKFSAILVVPLPFKLSDYMDDFKSSESKEEFVRLLGSANEMIELPDMQSRAASYLAAGNYLLDHIDFLIALWDGEPARGLGGTAQIVEIARHKNMPLAWIRTTRSGDNFGDQTIKTIPPKIIIENFPHQNNEKNGEL